MRMDGDDEEWKVEQQGEGTEVTTNNTPRVDPTTRQGPMG